jgi:hypothetical protein
MEQYVPAVITAKFCGPLTITLMSNVEKHSSLLLEVVICQDEQAKRAKDTLMCSPTQTAIKLVIKVGFIYHTDS